MPKCKQWFIFYSCNKSSGIKRLWGSTHKRMAVGTIAYSQYGAVTGQEEGDALSPVVAYRQLMFHVD